MPEVDDNESKQNGEAVWKRQAPIRELGRRGDALRNQLVDYHDALTEQCKKDGELIITAIESDLVRLPVGTGKIERSHDSTKGRFYREITTIRLREICDSIRSEAQNSGVPWRGLAPEELVTALRQEESLRIVELEHLISISESRAATAKDGMNALNQHMATFDCSVASAKRAVLQKVTSIKEALDKRKNELLGDLDDIVSAKRSEFVMRQDQLSNACALASHVRKECCDILSEDCVGVLRRSRLSLQNLEAELDDCAARLSFVRKAVSETAFDRVAFAGDIPVERGVEVYGEWERVSDNQRAGSEE